MSSSKVSVSSRIEQGHYDRLQELVEESGKSESQLLREAIAQYLGENNLGPIQRLTERLTLLERKVARMQRLFLEDGRGEVG